MRSVCLGLFHLGYPSFQLFFARPGRTLHARLEELAIVNLVAVVGPRLFQPIISLSFYKRQGGA